MSNGLATIGSKVPLETHRKLRWLAYDRGTTVSEIVASWVEERLASEDLSRYEPPRGG